MSKEDALYSGMNGQQNISAYLGSVSAIHRQRGRSVAGQPRDNPLATAAAAAPPMPLSDTLAYAQLAAYYPYTSILDPAQPWGATPIYASRGMLNPHYSAMSSSNGEVGTYHCSEASDASEMERQSSETSLQTNPWVSDGVSSPSIFPFDIHTAWAQNKVPHGYYPLPLQLPTAHIEDQRYADSEPMPSITLQRPMSSDGSEATVMNAVNFANFGLHAMNAREPWDLSGLGGGSQDLPQLNLHQVPMSKMDDDNLPDIAAKVGANFLDAVNDPDFSLGYTSNIQPTPLSEFKDAVVGVEATAYLQNLIDEGAAHEPLLAALGGEPIGLKYHIENELDKWKENGMRPLFVFDGQSIVGKDEMALRNARNSLLKTQAAWNLYGDHHPNDAVKAFGSSGTVRVQDLYRVLQEVLAERSMEFIIAPFSACAQLIYLLDLEINGKHIIDTVMGSKELFLYDKSPDSMLVFPPCTEDWDNKTFRGLFRSEAMEKLVVSSEMLDDALLMVGTSFLPPFPPLLQVESIILVQPFTLVDAVNLLRTSEKSVTSTCAAFQDILEKRDPKWLDKYRKAKMGVKHAIIVQKDGTVISRDYNNLTSDNTEYLGLQLPPELYAYLSKALIGPRIMNYFISLELVVFPTLDGVDSEEYKRLVTQSLIPLKEATAALIASRIHRVFQFKSITIKYWFDENLSRSLEHKNTLAQINAIADSWRVLDSELTPLEKTLKVPTGKITFAALSLQEKNFPSRSIFKSSKDSQEKVYLNSRSEILSNTLYRLLHLRGYVNDKHELTSWGKALATTLKAIEPIVKQYKDIHQAEEAAFLAFELLRFESLNSENRHPELIGGPLRGSEEDKANCILIGRAACLLKLRHKNVGYTGPLSKNFLAYHSLVKAVREADRDLVEAIVASMFLSDQSNRSNSHDFGDLGRSLPFAKAVNTIFGIAVTTYLDDFLKPEWSAEERNSNKAHYAEKFVPHSINFVEDLEVAFAFFDAVYAGVKTLPATEVSAADKQAWEGAKTYLDKRR